ncbi:MAG: YqgE/AlgH family protein [Acidobacteria bacterium]|nr:MAG: YqgE/AlgH family protein [Acidobacteriota bacterium]
MNRSCHCDGAQRALKGLMLAAMALLLPVLLPVLPTSEAAVRSGSLPDELLRPIPTLRGRNSGLELAKGRFLVASRDLRDPNFSKTVVLLLDYNEMGAMGLVINRPTELSIATALPDVEGLEDRKETVWVGGPVATYQMLMLVQSSDRPEDSDPVFDDVYVSGSRGLLGRLVEAEGEAGRFRIFAGHAGWAPMQLDAEVARGGWEVLPADADMVFDETPAEVWPDLSERGAVKWASLRSPRQRGSSS